MQSAGDGSTRSEPQHSGCGISVFWLCLNQQYEVLRNSRKRVRILFVKYDAGRIGVEVDNEVVRV
jgi:hypothetical protein